MIKNWNLSVFCLFFYCSQIRKLIMKYKSKLTFLLLLLLWDTDSSSTSASGLGMLTSDTDTPVMSETTMGADLLKTFQVLTEFVVKSVGCYLRVFAILNVLLSIQEPIWNLVVTWVQDDRHDSVNLVCY